MILCCHQVDKVLEERNQHFLSNFDLFLFQIFSHLSVVLRSSLLFFEIRRRIDSEVDIFVGESFKYSELGTDLSNDELADMLRTKTYLLDKKYLSAPPYGLDPD